MNVPCIICLGSNYHRDENFLLAHQRLFSLFPTICFAEAHETRPVALKNAAMFMNQLGIFYTNMSMDRVIEKLKNIEHEAGRLPEDKAFERVCLDIDLLSYDDCVLKPDDFKRDYIVEGLKELKSNYTKI